MTDTEIPLSNFADFGLDEAVVKAVRDLGYETPSPIQAQAIPHLLAGKDLVGQAQTGTGKTAAFALPLLSRIDLKIKDPQVLVLAPTRELAIQVAEAFQGYAKNIKNFHVLPIYGGQSYSGQLKQLKRGVHVVVGTPGRVMDHIRRGTLILSQIKTLVLDEGDEMLRMGFIDDVEWIIEQTPKKRQVALFSATMPAQIRKIAQNYLHHPEEITISSKTATVETTNQRYWMVSGHQKLDVLTRIMEAESFDAMLIFVKTKITTTNLAERLAARGYACAALNGDIQQNQREKTVNALKSGKLNILVATDVAARGLDVERISHVINYDIPYDVESYVHRIGRTGRMGRIGEAILFVTPREKRLLRTIERATRQEIALFKMPTTADLNDRRIERFKQQITDTLAGDDLEPFSRIVEQYSLESDVPSIEIAAALAKLAQGDTPLLLEHTAERPRSREKSPGRSRSEPTSRGGGQPSDERSDRGKKSLDGPRDRSARSSAASVEIGMERYKIQVGSSHGVKAGNIVGAIANEAGLDSEYIGRIDIHDEYATVDLPEGMPRRILKILSEAVVAGRRMHMTLAESSGKAGKPGKENFKRGRGNTTSKRGGNRGKPASRDKRRRK